MIIKKITIENFLCYYDVKEFELSDGLNIVLGENGEGKTKFFEALEWLFRGGDEDLSMLVSAKALGEAVEGEEFNVRVAITTEQDHEKQILSKSFRVKKIDHGVCETFNLTLKGIQENREGERTPTDGERLLELIFPSHIRRYSLFKGESELDIFKNSDALEILIKNFSQAAKYYNKYTEKGKYLRVNAENAVETSTRQSNKKAAEYKRLESEIEVLNKQKNDIVVLINAAEKEIEKLDANIKDAGKYVNNASALDTINERINKIEKKIREAYGRIRDNYTEGLFDENWILVNFESVQKDFTEKVNSISKERRRLQSEYDKEKGKKEGEKKLKEELLKNAIPLPVTVPSRAVMEEMLADELCKVCNREAKKGSDAYEFMMTRLKNYLASQETTEEEQENEEFFKQDYTSRLVMISTKNEDSLKNLRSVKNEIKDIFEFNKSQKEMIAQFEKDLEKEREERDRILGDSKLKEDDLTNVLKNYTNWQEDLKAANRTLLREQNSLNDVMTHLKTKKDEKDKIDLESANTFLVKTREILRDIELIFTETKEQKFDEFIYKLQAKSNEFFNRINVESFTGTVSFTKRKVGNDQRIDVDLEETGRVFHKPNQSLLTSMHISILFAISELASEAREDKFPLIFDAPTSSFGENKTTEFLNLIYETDGQKILLLKDFLVTNPVTKTLETNIEFDQVKRDKAFWIRLQRPFDKKKLETLNTEIISL
jgi:DNA sulfur modification protein DndD